VRVLAQIIEDGWPGVAIFAGEAIGADALREAERLGVGARVLSVVQPSQRLLRALYSQAHCLVFPSFGEGFGYPILEAQACGCPVVSSKATSLEEVVGSGGFLHEPEDTSGMAASVLAFRQTEVRQQYVTAGRANLMRFTEQGLVDGCLALYRDVLAARYSGKEHL
jgi:glycosyltransferase involved in cell wall biosynthesis